MNPKRKALELEITKRMVERYGFLKYPVTYEDHHTKDGGIIFGMGAFGGVAVDEIRIFEDGFLVSTGESTDFAETVFTDLMALLKDAGAEYRPELLVDVSYISALVIRSQVDLGRRLASPLDSAMASAFPGKPTGFSAMSFYVGENTNLDAVRLERLASEPPAKNEYWSQAALTTAAHFQLLQDFERLLG